MTIYRGISIPDPVSHNIRQFAIELRAGNVYGHSAMDDLTEEEREALAVVLEEVARAFTILLDERCGTVAERCKLVSRTFAQPPTSAAELPPALANPPSPIETIHLPVLGTPHLSGTTSHAAAPPEPTGPPGERVTTEHGV